tara:strand:+ start:2137 stop:2427 length:291 start_codon:yes stop_codon:yes gene_type:complete
MEEVIYRKWIMDFLDSYDFSVIIQVILSGLASDIIHLLWGIKNRNAGANVFISTSLLGFALAFVYIVSERSLAPCIVAHYYYNSTYRIRFIDCCKK